jgi:hypothetical protein
MKKEFIFKHGKIMLKGFARMLHGTLTAGWFALSAIGFAAIPTDGGYTAVAEFIAATAAACIGLAFMYAQGAGKLKRGDAKKGRFAA